MGAIPSEVVALVLRRVREVGGGITGSEAGTKEVLRGVREVEWRGETSQGTKGQGAGEKEAGALARCAG